MAKATKQAKPKRPVGRPKTVTPEVQEEICKRIALGRSLRKVSEDADLPGKDPIYREMLRNADFATAIARAREAQADLEYDEFREVTDAIKAGAMDPNAGKVVLWALTWRMAHMKPKTYGERLDVEHGGNLTVKFVKQGD